MKANYKKTFIGSIVAFVLGTSCCWLTSLVVWLGGATFLTVFATFLGKFQIVIIIFAVLLFMLGLLQLWTHRNKRRKI
jgi:membrane protein implicated in regulation of membrane protease activity